MNDIEAAAAPITGKLGAERYSFRRLSKRDIAAIKGVMEDDPTARRFISVFDVHRWAATEDGADVVLVVASGKAPAPGQSWEPAINEIAAMGSMVQRATLASVIVAESITTGEEVPASEGEHRPHPTSTKPGKP